MPRVNDPFERQHIANLSKYAKIIDEIFKAATKEAASIGVIVGNGNFDASRVFSFADYPITHKMIQSLLSRLANCVETAIVNGVEAEWTLANNKNNELSRRVFGDNVGKLTQEQYRKYFSSNDEARKAFLARKEQGLNLSERVWRYTECFKSDIELGLDIGIRNGLDAAQMSRQLRQFLQHPDMLFRRVRDEHGNLVLSKRASDFHPGRGVYRSSYKNARRLAVTETNMAYRSADYERMQQLDFVVGIEIRLSNKHTTPGKNGLPIPLVDICDELKGKYPKDFKFTGWHPHCRCHVVSILKTESELMQENAAILRGEEPSKDSVNRVNDVPDNFKQWLTDNADRIKTARSIPYFMQDNGTIKKGVFTLKEFEKHSVTTETIGTTDFDKEFYARRGLMQLWDARMEGWLNMDIKLDDIDNDIELGDFDRANVRIQTLLKSVERHRNRTPDDIRRIQDLWDERVYGKDYVDNVHIIEREIGIKRGKRMTHEQANTLRVNPHWSIGSGYDTNCSTCSATYVLRTMGFNLEAKANTLSNTAVHQLSYGMATWRKWKNGETMYQNTTDWMATMGYRRMTATRYMEFIDAFTRTPGIYEFNVGYKGGGGHSTLLRRLKDGTLERIEEQCRVSETLFEFLQKLTTNPGSVRGIMRVDNAQFNALYSDIFVVVK